MRIVIADHQDKVRYALRTLLRRQIGLDVVGEAITAGELLDQVSLHDPDLVVLHWRLCEEMADLLTQVRQICPGISVLVLSARPEARCDALAAGADAFACKMDSPKRLLATLETLTNGRARSSRPTVLLPADANGDEGALNAAVACGGSERPPASP